MKKKILIGCLLVVLVMVGAIGNAFYQTMKEGDRLSFSTIELHDITDGTYVGDCDAGLVKVTAQVKVQSGKLQDIQLLTHQNGMGSDAEEILPIMIKENSFAVDSVAGATISSKCIRKACENAVTQKEES